MTLDRKGLDGTIARLNASLSNGCAGGIELQDAGEDGTVRLQLLGMCGGCSCRALTIGVTLRPTIEAVDGVRQVVIANSGISKYAEQRIAQAFARKRSQCPSGR
jgi:Fe-S cluster biogenesis protein NfuA